MRNLFFLLFASVSAIAQVNPTSFSKIKVINQSEKNDATRVVVQDANSKEFHWVLKSSLGGGGTIPTLQQVTNVGSNITNNIFTTGYYSATTHLGGGMYGFVNLKGYGLEIGTNANRNAGNPFATLKSDLISVDREHQLPDISGTLVVDSQLSGLAGESNTASNVGVAGVGVFKQKTGVNLEFKNLNSSSNKVYVTDDIANNEIDINVNESNFSDIPQSAVTNLTTDLALKANDNAVVHLSGNETITGIKSIENSLKLGVASNYSFLQTTNGSLEDDFGSLYLNHSEEIIFNSGLNGVTVNSPLSARGLRGSINYSSTITDLDYTQKIYVDNALLNKQDNLVSGTSIKSINGNSVLGSGNLVVGDALVSNDLSQFASTTSSQLAGVVSDETGAGSLVFGTNPVLATPIMSVVSEPIAPNTGGIKLYGKLQLAEDVLTYKNFQGQEFYMQDAIFLGRKKGWFFNGTTTVNLFGQATTLTATGTLTATNVATTNEYTKRTGSEYLITTATTNAVAGFRESVNSFWLGNTVGDGGFSFSCNFGQATGVTTTTHRLFVGMSTSTSAPTDVNPSTLTNMFGVAYDDTDVNLQIMRNDGTGVATKIDLGSNFLIPFSDRTNMYRLDLYAAPNSIIIYYKVTNLVSGNVATGNFATDIPAVNTLMSARGYMSVGGTSSVIGLKVSNIEVDSIK